MLKKYLFIGLVIASLMQQSFAADFGTGADVRTPPPHDLLERFRATGSDQKLREEEAEEVAKLKRVSGLGITPRVSKEVKEQTASAEQPQTPQIPELRAVNLLARLQPLEETHVILHPDLGVVINQIPPRLEVPFTAQRETSQPLAQQEPLGFFGDIQGRATQSLPPPLDNLGYNDELAFDAPNSPVSEAAHDGNINDELAFDAPNSPITEVAHDRDINDELAFDAPNSPITEVAHDRDINDELAFDAPNSPITEVAHDRDIEAQVIIPELFVVEAQIAQLPQGPQNPTSVSFANNSFPEADNLEEPLDKIDDTESSERQSPSLPLDVSDTNEEPIQNSPRMEAGLEILDFPVEEDLINGIEAQVIIPEPVVEEARLAHQQQAIHNPVSAFLNNSLHVQDNLSDTVDASTTRESNQNIIPSKEAEVKHAKIQTAQPVGLHGLTAHLVNTTSFRMATPMAGVAAGSEDLITYGFWSSAFGTFGKQRDTLDEKRFKFIQKGVVVGADGLLNENILLGIAYSNSAILRTYDTEDLMSNKQKIMSHIFSLYGSYKFDNPFYVSAQVQYGKIHLKARRKSNVDTSIFVSGETKGQMYGGKIEAGYNFNNIDGLYFIPKLGISYNSSQLRAFNESGTGVAFRFHDSMKSSRLATSAGLEIRKKFAAKYHILVPSMYFAVEKILIQKNGNVRISNEELSLNHINLVTKSPRDKEAFMIGGKISAYNKKGYEVDLGYDLLLQSKYQSHTGSVKFKVNF